MKKKLGFTIVEVLVVIGIIAILTAIILPSLDNIKKKNRDTERVADIAAIRLGLSMYYSKHQTGTGAGYPESLDDLLSGGYVTQDSLTTPDGGSYLYVPLTRTAGGDKCTSYHLGVQLDLGSEQIDPNDHFDSTGGENNQLISAGNYYWCGSSVSQGINGNTPLMYHVRP